MKSTSWVLFFGILVLTIPGSAQTEVSEQVRGVCRKVSEIKQLPHDGNDKGIDAAYDEITASGLSLVPCLIDQITNRTITHDPRCPHITDETTIGAVSFFLLVDLLKIEFTQFFPENVKASFKTNGVYAYHEYIETTGARADLQKKLREFWRATKDKRL